MTAFTTRLAEPDAGRGASGGRGAEISCARVSKRYGTVRALDDISLHVPPGSFTVLLGPSGSGKTTLLRSIAGIERVDGGRIELRGGEVSSATRSVPPEKRNLGMVFQDYALWPHLTVAGNVGYALRRRGSGHSRSSAAQAVAAMLERVGLGHLGERYPNELSGGQQQRVALARAMVGSPSLVLFDEPLSNLDADLRERLRLEISVRIREAGATAVYITHDQGEAFALADVVAVLDRGRIVQTGTPEEIYTRPASPFVARFTGLAGTIPGTIARIESIGQTCYAAVDIPGGRIKARLADEGSPGQHVTVFVRPTATTLVSGAVPDSANAVEGTVVDLAYRGRSYDHVVRGQFGSLSSVAAPLAAARGERCAVVIEADSAIAFPREDDASDRH
ncbi:ABC transporter ATP-binding protein [Arthrobacter sp. FW306-2-2C-D06B]|uniref:ABC transporter ATP-binding protein n=1 Tax=Arthrobacter sp. FW306-2-2C-D06B TaxID=2879618 RepID=UPI001F3CE669|nr:ABC transporter ATP-binding protein [Arthrobacter sp. FW306-2-2C-D06B]UKA57230.1 ABC transporter ATP-binding protein [Arthrobacter sp. FW306-2-2C-D06B]